MRLSASGRRPKPEVPCLAPSKKRERLPSATRLVGFLGHADLIESAVIDRNSLGREVRLSGPAIIEQYESTIVLPPTWETTVDEIGNLILRSYDSPGNG